MSAPNWWDNGHQLLQMSPNATFEGAPKQMTIVIASLKHIVVYFHFPVSNCRHQLPARHSPQSPVLPGTVAAIMKIFPAHLSEKPALSVLPEREGCRLQRRYPPLAYRDIKQGGGRDKRKGGKFEKEREIRYSKQEIPKKGVSVDGVSRMNISEHRAPRNTCIRTQLCF